MKRRPLFGQGFVDALQQTGEITRFGLRFFRDFTKRPFELGELLRQSYELGYRSIGLVGITAFIMGLVLTVQSRPTLIKFGAESMLPSMVALSIVREIGPVVTALICAGKISSGIGAELGSMRVTEQIDAMEVSGTHPFRYVVVTRILATTLTIPILALLADAIAMQGSFLAINFKAHVTFELFFHKIIKSLEFTDLFPAFIKTFFFGFAIGLVGCYKGYNASNGTEGVGRAANTAVVTASLLIFVIDLLAAQLTDMLYA